MSTPKNVLVKRLFRPEKKNKTRAHRCRQHRVNIGRFLSLKDRQTIVEMCSIEANRMAEIAVNIQLKRLGAFSSRSQWKEEYRERILFLYSRRRQVKAKRSQLKSFAKVPNLYNCSPHFVAKAFSIHPKVVYNVLRIFAWTGEVKFCRDKRSHVSYQMASENPREVDLKHKRNLFHAATVSSQTACKKRHPRFATKDDFSREKFFDSPHVGGNEPTKDNEAKEVVDIYERTDVNDYPTNSCQLRFIAPAWSTSRDFFWRATALHPTLYASACLDFDSHKPFVKLSGMQLVRKCYFENVKRGLIQDTIGYVNQESTCSRTFLKAC